jgi:hypothetical protein
MLKNKVENDNKTILDFKSEKLEIDKLRKDIVENKNKIDELKR